MFLNEHDTQLLQQAHETLLGMVDCVAANQKLSPVPPLLADQLEVLAAEASDKALADEKAVVTNIPEIYVDDTVVEAVSSNITEPSGIVIQPLNQDDIDLDILETFVSEADELLEEIDQALQGWERNWSSKDHVESLKRA